MSDDFYDGFDSFSNELTDYLNKMSNDSILDTLQIGADELVKDLLRLPKPKSKIKASGYTHLINTFASRQNKGMVQVEVGWGKYYGPMVNNGTVKFRGDHHLDNCFDRNKEKYYTKMIKHLGL